MNSKEEQNLIIKTMARLEINKTLVELKEIDKKKFNHDSRFPFKDYIRITNNLLSLCELTNAHPSVAEEITQIQANLYGAASSFGFNLYQHGEDLDEVIVD